MKFETQICTTKEQSERLLALGLKKETADMKHFFDNRDDYSFFHRWKCWPYKWDEESLIDSENIPAWSLHRLIEMIPSTLQDLYELDFSKRGVYYADFSNGSYNFIQSFAKLDKTLYDNIIDCIEWLIKVKYINKEYLN